MKGIISFSFILLLSISIFSQGLLVDVVDNTLKVAGFSEEVFYYGFAEGDQLIFNFEDINGREIQKAQVVSKKNHILKT